WTSATPPVWPGALRHRHAEGWGPSWRRELERVVYCHGALEPQVRLRRRVVGPPDSGSRAAMSRRMVRRLTPRGVARSSSVDGTSITGTGPACPCHPWYGPGSRSLG